MLDYRTLYKIMRKYYDPGNSTSYYYYIRKTGKMGINDGPAPGSRRIPTGFPQQTKVRFHFAFVTDNKDPDGYSRVKVKFPQWGDNIETGWIPVIKPFGGADRGIFTLPEIDEKVLCCFFMDNPSRAKSLKEFIRSLQVIAGRNAKTFQSSFVRCKYPGLLLEGAHQLKQASIKNQF